MLRDGDWPVPGELSIDSSYMKANRSAASPKMGSIGNRSDACRRRNVERLFHRFGTAAVSLVGLSQGHRRQAESG
jgi:hypothetical protein